MKFLSLLLHSLPIRWHAVAVLLFLPASLPVRAASQNSTNQRPGYVEGELLVKFKGGPKGEGAGKARVELRHTVKRDFEYIGWQHIKLPPGLTVEQALEKYRRHPDVLAVEPNFITTIDEPVVDPVPMFQAAGGQPGVTPNDPLYPQQWGLPKINGPTAWAINTGSTNVVVAVIDTGVNYNHQDLAGNMWRNPGEIPGNGIDDDNNGYVDDVYGINAALGTGDPVDMTYLLDRVIYHGTEIASIIGAIGNDALGVAGLNWKVRLMAVSDVKDDSGSSEYSDTIKAIEYVIHQKAAGANVRVINFSAGGRNITPVQKDAFRDAIDAVGNAGIVFVTIAHNYNEDVEAVPIYPACFDSPSIIAVAASTETDAKAGFSSYGAVHIHLAAPGQNILMSSGAGTSGYVSSQGTSYAAPFVAGAVALLAAENPNATVAELKAAILDTVDVVPAFLRLTVTGGRLNVAHALLQISTNQPPVFVTQPHSGTVARDGAIQLGSTCFGTPTITYQWFRDGLALPGETNRTIQIADIRSNSVVWVEAQNSAGLTESEHATIKVAPLPIVAWGYNAFGQCDVPDDMTNAVAVAGGRYHTIALRSDGTARCWGDNSLGQCNVPQGLQGIRSISAGANFNLALLSNGTVVAWGENNSGQLNVPAGLNGVISVAGGQFFALALKSDGTVAAWGANNAGQSNVPLGLSDVVQVAGGFEHAVALKRDGTVVAWGQSANGELNIPPGLAPVASIVASSGSTIALLRDGTVTGWGRNLYGELNIPSGLSNIIAIAGYRFAMVLKPDRTVQAWGAGMVNTGTDPNYGQATIPAGLRNVIALNSNGRHSLALISTAPDAPPLSITSSGTDFLVSWPDLAIVWRVESTKVLGNGADWQPWPELPIPTQGTNVLFVPSTNVSRFFRLRFP